jgi:hypothetical protein
MKNLMNLFLVAVVGVFVAGGALVDTGVNCSGDKHGDADKKHSDGH